jgi:hypothetical protein
VTAREALRRARERATAWRDRLSEHAAAACALLVILGYAASLGILHIVPRYDCLVFPGCAWVAFWLLERVRGRLLAGALLAIGTALALGVLLHLWTTGHEGRSAVLLGIVPYSDAGAFYGDAQRLLHGLRIGESSRRALYVGVAGAILRWSGDDLRVMLGIGAAAYGASIGLVAWEVMRTHGRTCGLLVTAVLYFWVRRFIGFVATEALSFPLGAMAFVLLLRVADNARGRPVPAALAFGAAIFVLTLAFIARPGSLLAVPALFAWVPWAFPDRRSRLTAVGLGGAGVLVAVLASRTLTSSLASGATFGDYPNILYALVHQGDLYRAVFDHPELARIDESARGDAILQILAADVGREPILLVKGPVDALLSFLGGPHGFFSSIWTNPDDHVLEDGPLVRRLIAEHGYVGPVLHWIRELGLFSLVNAVVMGALGAGFVVGVFVAIVRLVRVRREPRAGLLLAVVFGVIASSIFAPTWIGEGMQMQTAVAAFVPTSLALGLTGRIVPEGPEVGPLGGLARLALAVPLVLALLVVGATLWPLSTTVEGCAPFVMSARLNPSTRVVVRPAGEPPPNERSLAKNLSFLRRHNPDLVSSVEAVAHVGDVMEIVYDACSTRTRTVFGASGALPEGREWKVLRFEPQRDPGIARVSVP